MSDLARQLIEKVATDPEFREALDSAQNPDEKRAILASQGFGELSAQDVTAGAALIQSSVQELSDEQILAAAKANDTITTTTTTTTVFAGAAAAVAAA